MKAKNITIDDLALIVSKGFTENREYMDKRFDKIDERFDRVEGRLDDLEKDVREIKDELIYIKIELGKRVDNFSHKDLELRVEKMEKKLKKYEKLLAEKV